MVGTWEIEVLLIAFELEVVAVFCSLGPRRGGGAKEVHTGKPRFGENRFYPRSITETTISEHSQNQSDDTF